MIVVIDTLFTQHDPGTGHPERPERITALLELVESLPYRKDLEMIPPRTGTWEEAAWVHDPQYLDLLKRTSGSRAMLDPDTRTSPQSVATALVAAGSVLSVAEKAQSSKRPGFAMIRPPGHHAERNRAMGFCLLNNVAIAAEWAVRQAGARRVAIVDFDVHHGNGTQHSFYDRNDILYISSHQFPFYPGTGALKETGIGPGKDFTVNFPLSAGTGDGVLTRIYEQIVPPILEQFQPDWIFVSAGYDAHRDDPLAQLEVSVEGFARVVRSLQECARRLCEGRIVYLLEGGYNLQALSKSVQASLEVILGKRNPEPTSFPDDSKWNEYVTALRRVHGRWKF
ncbi:MAG TPA: histone deacetylase [Acidobacteriota bacterium]|jgi:acetoin utilization deacetylase AcuC-like enzyme|nr:histone deacetylase [Acidobacteriota bacterium]